MLMKMSWRYVGAARQPEPRTGRGTWGAHDGRYLTWDFFLEFLEKIALFVVFFDEILVIWGILLLYPHLADCLF